MRRPTSVRQETPECRDYSGIGHARLTKRSAVRGGRGRWGDPVERVQLKPDIIVSGPAFAEPVQVITTIPVGDAVKLVGKGLRTNQVHEALLTSEQLASLKASPEHPAFDGDPQRFRRRFEFQMIGLCVFLRHSGMWPSFLAFQMTQRTESGMGLLQISVLHI